MADIASILRDGEDPSMPELRAWLMNLATTVAVATNGFRTFATVAALNAYTPAGEEPRYAFVIDGGSFKAYRYTGAAWAVDPTYFDGLSAVVQPLVTQAQASAAQAAAAAAAVVPLATATVASNDATLTQYNVTMPAGVNAGVEKQKFQFAVPATALGTTVRLNVSGPGVRDVFFVTRRQLRQGWLATFSANNGGFKWNFESQVPNDLSLVGAETNASLSYAMIATIAGAQLARAINGNPNDLAVPSAPLSDSKRFTTLIRDTPTGTLFLTDEQSGNKREVVTASGAAFDATVIQGPAFGTFFFSGGYGKFVYSTHTPMPTLPGLKDLASAVAPDIWSVLASVVSQPYGTVTKGADNKPVFTPRTLHILGRGSSVSTSAADTDRKGGCPPDHVPVLLLRDGINRKFGPGISAVAWNGSFGGETADRSHKQWTEMRDAGMPIPDIAADCWGMNDSTPSAYNSGQVSPTFIPNGYYNDIKDKLDLGVKLFIIFTTPDEHTGRASYRLASSVPMYWPYAVSAPVAPDQLVPPATSTVENGGSVVNRDWTGRGIKTDGGARTAHVNDMLRDVVRRFNADPKYRGRVILGDAAWAWKRYGLEEHSPDELFDPGEYAHPNVLGHVVSYDRVIDEIVDSAPRSTGDKWWFRGEGVDTSAE